MSDVSRGPGWWQASDGRWYPPESHPQAQVPVQVPAPAAFPPADSLDGVLTAGATANGVAVNGAGANGIATPAPTAPTADSGVPGSSPDTVGAPVGAPSIGAPPTLTGPPSAMSGPPPAAFRQAPGPLQPVPGPQPTPGQPLAVQQPHPGQPPFGGPPAAGGLPPMPGQPMPGQPMPGQPPMANPFAPPAQPMPMPTPMQPFPGGLPVGWARAYAASTRYRAVASALIVIGFAVIVWGIGAIFDAVAAVNAGFPHDEQIGSWISAAALLVVGSTTFVLGIRLFRPR